MNNGAAIRAKSLMCVLKKLHNPTKDQMVLMSVGGLGSFMALSLFFPGLIPSGVRVKTRYDPSLLPNRHFSRLILR